MKTAAEFLILKTASMAVWGLYWTFKGLTVFVAAIYRYSKAACIKSGVLFGNTGALAGKTLANIRRAAAFSADLMISVIRDIQFDARHSMAFRHDVMTDCPWKALL